jgi:hypothetical protein
MPLHLASVAADAPWNSGTDQIFPFAPHFEHTIDWPSVGTTMLSGIRSNGGLLTSHSRSRPQTVQ